MRHQRHKRTLGVTTEHRKALLANLVTSLVEHSRVKTTLARAKEGSKLADKMVTLAKRNTLHGRRQIISTLRSPEAAKKLMDEFAPLFKDRAGGYTRVLKYRRRMGDNAQLAILEFTAFPEVKAPEKKVKKKKKPEKSEEETPTKTQEAAPKENKPKVERKEAPVKKSRRPSLFNFLRKKGSRGK